MKLFTRCFPLLFAPALLMLAGCGNSMVTATSANSVFSVSPHTGAIDTNCTGCNAANAQGGSVHQFTATLAGGGPAEDRKSTRLNSSHANISYAVFCLT